MDLYLKRELINSLSTLTEPEIKKYSTDRVILMQLCSTIIRKQTADTGEDFIALLNHELIKTDQTELAYLISNDKELTSNEEFKKQYLSWFILILTCALMQKNKEWVKEHEVMFFTVLSTNYTDAQLQKLWIKLRNDARRFDFATVQEVRNTNGFLDVNKTYVKVPCTQISKNLSRPDDKIIIKGFVFVEYEPNIRDLFICLLEQEWEAIWHEKVENIIELSSIFNIAVMEEIQTVLYTKHINRHKLAQQMTAGLPISGQALPEMAQEYFPPCMTNMLSSFREYGELKHDARKQLMLFLQDVGVPKTDILDLVRINYDRPHLIDKKTEVEYYMRHLLGVTEHVRNYNSYNCHQIQEHPVADGLAHGCYFKKTSKRLMEDDMTKLGLLPESRNMIHGKVLEGDYSAACTLHLEFKCRLKKAPTQIVKPNDYFNIARCPHQYTSIDIEDIMKWKENDFSD